MQNWESYAEISYIRLITITTKDGNFDIKKWFKIFFFNQVSSDYQKTVISMLSQKLNNHKVFNKYISSLVSIQRLFRLSHLLLRRQLPNGGETVSMLCGFGEDPLHTHPKRDEFFSSTHQSLQKVFSWTRSQK